MQAILSDTEMNALLASQVFGHMACTDGEQPYIVPMAYVYFENALYGQTTAGKKVEMLRKNPFVCFQVQSFTGGEWRSVLCRGTFQELDFTQLQKPEAVELVKLLTVRLGGIQQNVGISVPFSFSGGAAPLQSGGKESTLFRIHITEKTGRFFGMQQQATV